MTARERWQALQSELTTAKAAAERGDRTRAMEALDRALSIDPEFLAARALRERLMVTVPSADPTPPSVVSESGYAQFEARARRRRVDRRLDVAREAIAARRFREAPAAVQEIRELDPNAPTLNALIAALEAAKASRNPRRLGAAALSAASFAAVVFAATRMPEPRLLTARQTAGFAALVSAEPAAVADLAAPPAAPRDEPVAVALAPIPVPQPVDRIELPPAPVSAPAPREILDIVRPPAADPEPTPSPVAPVQPAVTPIASVITPRVVAPLVVADESLVQQTLQKYRRAYDGLDAVSAHAVWPAVNQQALARAFSGLESQSLTFNDCNVRVGGELASAVCRGQTRYVPKVGSREPRVEARTWTFTLRKSGPEWKIESARAEQ